MDGEIVVLDDTGRAVFQDLQIRSRRGDLRGVRRALRRWDVAPGRAVGRAARAPGGRSLPPRAPPKVIAPEDVVTGTGTALFGAIAKRGARGHRGEAARQRVPAGPARPRRGARSRCGTRSTGLIGGYVEGEGSRRGGIARAARRAGDRRRARLRRAGRARGSPMPASRELRRRLERLDHRRVPVREPASGRGRRSLGAAGARLPRRLLRVDRRRADARAGVPRPRRARAARASAPDPGHVPR